MDAIRDEVTRYAVDTKHRPHQYETADQVAHVMRKMIASHMRVVPWGAVYLHVSPGDYQRVVKRTPFDLGQRVAPPAEFYAALPAHVEREPSKQAEGIYEAFSEHIYPELRKSPYERSENAAKDQQKALALFISQATDGNTREVVNLLYPDDSAKRERERVYDAVVSYGPLKHEYDTDEAVAREMGYFLRSMYFPDVENGKLYIVEPLDNREQEYTDAMETEAARAKTATTTGSSSEIQWAVPDQERVVIPLDDNKSVQAWKTQHALSPMFSSEKAAKQMLTQYHTTSSENDYEDIFQQGVVLGKFQHANDLLEGEAVRALVSEEDVAHAYRALLSQASPESIDTLMQVPQVKSFVDSLVHDMPRSQLEKLTRQDVLTMFMGAKREEGLSKEFIKQMMSV